MTGSRTVAARRNGDHGERLTVASLNTRGRAFTGSLLSERYRAIARAFEASEVDVVSFQEVLTYYHLRKLTRHMPSFRYVSYRPTIAGPAGGVATLSRLPMACRGYRRFPLAPNIAGVPRLTRFKALLKGTLLTRLMQPDLSIVTTHPLANTDGDWSPTNRFYPLQRRQLAAVAGVVRAVAGPVVVCGDFNVARESLLFKDFVAETGLADTFGGQCPPTFHAEYLSADRSPQCIDFILASGSVRTVRVELLFTNQQPLSAGPAYVSDHLGLCAIIAVG